ncbi:MAG: TonB-dependent receptor [bacterium]|nr:TonB-dependent receptor [bacterium]
MLKFNSKRENYATDLKRSLVHFALVVLFLSFPLVSYSGSSSSSTYGRIAGKIIDKKTGFVLPSVNITIVNTTKGSSTNFKGEYYIIGVPVGSYTIKASSVGYSTAVVEDVWISANLETVINFELETIVDNTSKEIVITGSRKNVGKLATGTFHIIEQEEIEKMPAENIFDLMSLLPGIVDGNIIRGGRSTDIDYLVDGVSIRDPLFGGILQGTFLNNLALREIQILTGGFNADNGNAMSGIVNLITRDGGSEWSSNFRIKNSLSGLNGRNGNYRLNSRGENILEFSAGGPIPINNNGLKLFFSGKTNSMDNRSPGLNVKDPAGNNITAYPHNQLKQINLFGKLTYKPTNNSEITFGAFYGNQDYDDDSWFWRYNGSYNQLPSVSRKNIFSYFRFTQFLTPNLFYEATIEYSDNKLTRGIKRLIDDYSWTSGYEYIRNFGFEIPVVFGTGNPYGVEDIFVTTGRLDSYWRARSKYIGTHVNLNGTVSNYFSFKTGFQAKKYLSDNFYRGNTFEEPSIYQATYKHEPQELRGYGKISTKVKNVNLDLGLLMHYLDPRSLDSNISGVNTSGDINAEASVKINPRIGLAYEIKKGIIVHGNYGWYYQLPTFHSLYADMDFDGVRSNLSVGGNPRLEPPRTIAFESGLTMMLDQNTSFDITGYNKKLYNLEDLTTYLATDNKIAEYTNSGKGRVFGIESSLSSRFTNLLSARLSYTYSVAKGTLSFLDPRVNLTTLSELDVAQPDIIFSSTVQESQSKNLEYYLPFDKRHNLRTVFNLTLPDDYGPEFYGFKPLQNLNASFTSVFESGAPYTLQTVSGEYVGKLNTYRHPWYSITNMRMQKYFNFTGFKMSAFFDVKNLFNRTAPRFYSPSTNSSYYTGLPLIEKNQDIGSISTYNPVADLNNDGIIDQAENNAAFIRFTEDYNKLRLLNQLPREVWFGLQFEF